MTTSKIFYPASIQADHETRPSPNADATGCKAMPQAMRGKNNLTHSQNPERYYPNTVTTFSGTWNIPSAFTVTKWNIPSNIPNDSIVKKITIEYAITHVQYIDQYVQNAGWAYDSDGCKFYRNELGEAGNVTAGKKL